MVSLKDDLEYIINNRKDVFDKTENVFDTYFIDKHQLGSLTKIRRLSTFTAGS